jgi:hypothetical protein
MGDIGYIIGIAIAGLLMLISLIGYGIYFMIERRKTGMTKQELVGIYVKLDKAKFKLLEKGVAFDFVIQENGGFLHTGIGTGADMSMMALYSLVDLFKHSNSKSIEKFADSVKEGLIKAYKDGVFDIQENGGE